MPFPEPQKLALAVSVNRYYSVYLLLVALGATLIGVLHASHSFFIVSLSPILFSVILIGSIVILAPFYGVYAMVVGVLLGGSIQLGLLWVQIRGKGYHLYLGFNFKDPMFKGFLRSWGQASLAALVLMFGQQFNFRLASELADGSVSGLSNALVIVQLPLGIFAVSLYSVLFPSLTRAVKRKDQACLRRLIQSALLVFAYLLLPLSLLCFFFAEDIVSLIFERGRFGNQEVFLVARLLKIYILSLFLVACVGLFQRVLYAYGYFSLHLALVLGMTALDVLLAIVLRNIWGIEGIAWAYSWSHLSLFLVFLGLFVWIFKASWKTHVRVWWPLFVWLILLFGGSLLLKYFWPLFKESTGSSFFKLCVVGTYYWLSGIVIICIGRFKIRRIFSQFVV